MSKNYEFISANELPMAESDNVNILCVEGGELKLKTPVDIKNLPVTESGDVDVLCMENGELKRKSSKPKYDFEVKLWVEIENEVYDEENGWYYDEKPCGEILSGNFADAYEKLLRGEIVTARVHENTSAYSKVDGDGSGIHEGYTFLSYYTPPKWDIEEYGENSGLYGKGDVLYFNICEDNTIKVGG